MAKNKVSRNSNGASSEQQKLQSKSAPVMNKKSAELNRQSSMEDHDLSEEKFQNLKSLNAILLKQTMENRQQIESLSQAKKALEDDLTRSGEEKILLREELCGLSDESFMVKIETGLFMGFVESSFKEMGVEIDVLVKEKSDREREIRDLKREVDCLMGKIRSEREELSRVCDERDLFKSGFDLKCEEMNQLEGSVVMLEMKEASLGEEVGKLKSTNGKLVEEMSKRAELINNRLSKESSEMEKDLEEKMREIDELKSEIKGVMREKMEIEMVKRDQKDVIVELEKKLSNLNEIVKSLTKEEEGLRDQVIGLEKNLDEVMDDAKLKAEQINALVEEKAVKESELENLLVENLSIQKQMEMAHLQSSAKEKQVEQLLLEKNELVEHVINQEAEFVELSKRVDEQKHVAAQLKKDYDDQTKTSEKLRCNVIQLKDAMRLVEVERDNAGKALAEEKRNRLALKEKAVELEKVIEARGKELVKIKSERERLIKEKKELENRSASLRKEKSILQKDIVEFKKATGVLKTELESARTNAKHNLTMLKNVCSLVSGFENKKGIKKREMGMDPYFVELEAIKEAFKNKESTVDGMKMEIEEMKHSVKDAQKKKSFWTLVSSITSLFMAASVAYAASNK